MPLLSISLNKIKCLYILPFIYRIWISFITFSYKISLSFYSLPEVLMNTGIIYYFALLRIINGKIFISLRNR